MKRHNCILCPVLPVRRSGVFLLVEYKKGEILSTAGEDLLDLSHAVGRAARLTLGRRSREVLAGSSGVLLYPGHITVHPGLEERFAVRADAAVCVEKAILDLKKGLGLPHGRHVEVGEHVAQMLL